MGGYYGINPDGAPAMPWENDPNAMDSPIPQAPKPKKPNRLLKTLQGGGAGMQQQQPQAPAWNPVQTYAGLGDAIGTVMRERMGTGGYADQPMDVTIGEGGEPEYVVPAGKLKNFAAQVSVGSPIDPKLLPPDDGPKYTPFEFHTGSSHGLIKDAQPYQEGRSYQTGDRVEYQGFPGVIGSSGDLEIPNVHTRRPGGTPPPPLDTPGPPPMPQGPPRQAQQGPSPQMQQFATPGFNPNAKMPTGGPPPLTTPGQASPQLPQVPQMKKAGILQKLGAAAIGGLGGYVNAAGRSKIGPATIEGAEQGILHPGYGQQMQQYKLGTERAQAQGKLNTEAAQAEQARAHANLANQQTETLAEEGKKPYITVPGGGLFNVKTGQWVRQPVDKSQLTPITKEQADAYGIGPLADGTYALPSGAVAAHITNQRELAPKASVHLLPDGSVISYTPGEATAKVVYKGDPKVETDLTMLQVGGKPHQVIVNKQTGALIKDLGESGIKPPVTNVINEQRKDRTAGLKAYTPALESAERFNVMAKNYEDAVKNHDQQAMLSLLANHLGMTMGLQKGARLTKDIIHEAENSRPWLQGLVAKFDKNGYLSGVNLTPEQMRQMVSLGRERFAEDILKGKSEAKYMGIEDDGPTRTPSSATINHYTAMANGDPAKAKELAAADGWSIR